jgi:hypothetical protein
MSEDNLSAVTSEKEPKQDKEALSGLQPALQKVGDEYPGHIQIEPRCRRRLHVCFRLRTSSGAVTTRD